LRTAGFILLATAMRPMGGNWADRLGGETLLRWVFPVVSLGAILMAIPGIVSFTVGALIMAAAIGVGNGAVFKLVPQYFPTSVGTVTGLVGAAGGLVDSSLPCSSVESTPTPGRFRADSFCSQCSLWPAWGCCSRRRGAREGR